MCSIPIFEEFCCNLSQKQSYALKFDKVKLQCMFHKPILGLTMWEFILEYPRIDAPIRFVLFRCPQKHWWKSPSYIICTGNKQKADLYMKHKTWRYKERDGDGHSDLSKIRSRHYMQILQTFSKHAVCISYIPPNGCNAARSTFQCHAFLFQQEVSPLSLNRPFHICGAIYQTYRKRDSTCPKGGGMPSLFWAKWEATRNATSLDRSQRHINWKSLSIWASQMQHSHSDSQIHWSAQIS